MCGKEIRYVGWGAFHNFSLNKISAATATDIVSQAASEGPIIIMISQMFKKCHILMKMIIQLQKWSYHIKNDISTSTIIILYRKLYCNVINEKSVNQNKTSNLF